MKKLLILIDNLLNRITIYRLVLYYLFCLLAIAFMLSLIHLMPYDFLSLITSTLVLLGTCWISNFLLAKIFKATTNVESVYISALILTLIITPVKTIQGFIFLGAAAGLAMASKYILAIGKKHVFNPAAVAVVLTGFIFGNGASWWIGNVYMVPAVLIGGLLVTRKIQKEKMVLSFFITMIIISAGFTLIHKGNVLKEIFETFLRSPLLFFAFVLLSEPQTTPPQQWSQIIYGALVGFLYVPEIHLGPIYSTPELALVIGNLWSYAVSPKYKIVLRLKEKVKIAPEMVDLIFPLQKKLAFLPGQYMEWTLPHTHPDNRGNRRYFTIASSPTEKNLLLGIKFYPNSSSFKQAIVAMRDQDQIVAGQLAGDFVLSKNPSQKYVFIAGGIGITPYRSILKYLIDTAQKKDIVLIYSNKNQSEIVYKDIFDQAQKQLDIKTIYTLTDLNNIPKNWTGQKGRIDFKMIEAQIPDYQERIFYLSGPHAMVEAFAQTLKSMGIKNNKIKKDFFPGYV